MEHATGEQKGCQVFPITFFEKDLSFPLLMKSFLCFILLLPILCLASVRAGIGKTDITPPIGTPSAGYSSRKGEGMQGVHDPLLAIALFIDNGERKIALCSVDHLGFTYEMGQEISRRIHNVSGLQSCEIYIASSHTHSGGGAFLNIPFVGEVLAGPYDPEKVEFYIQQTEKAILEASQNLIPVKVGIGYGQTEDLSSYRGQWPLEILPLSDVSIIKVTKIDGSPFAVLFNYPVHPTIVKSANRLFSSDFVGYARDRIQALLGSEIQPIYFNGAQGDIIPNRYDEDDFSSCHSLGDTLAQTIAEIWNRTKTSDALEISFQKETYSFKPQATPKGLLLPVDLYTSEINLLVLNRSHAFLTIPGELSCIYDRRLKEIGHQLEYEHVSIFGLVNDAHGYIISPESWRFKTFESNLSFGGEEYGPLIEQKAVSLLQSMR